MRTIAVPRSHNVLIGMGDADDAAVIRFTDDIALVQTLDFITPIVDDPFMFGRIAAANSLSDVYAMGGYPIAAMNIVCFPTSLFSLEKLTEILRGGISAIVEANADLVGGHTVEDKELKYGLSVTGIVHPKKIIRNTGLRPGDAIVLTKPLGTGIIATAVKAGIADTQSIDAFHRSMAMLNKNAAEVMNQFPIHACTDVTGFGLAGHLKEMIGNDSFEIEINTSALPILPNAVKYAAMGFNPAGLYRNKEYVAEMIAIAQSVNQELVDVVYDPQTSGGLLIALDARVADEFVRALKEKGITDAHVIGMVFAGMRRIRLV